MGMLPRKRQKGQAADAPPVLPVRVYAKVAVADEAGRILLLRRSATHPSKAGLWDLPGGIVSVATGEMPLAAARREVAEETGLALGPLVLAGLHSDVQEPAQGRAAYCLGILCAARARPGSVVLSAEHDAWRWAKPGCPCAWREGVISDLPEKYQRLVRVAAGDADLLSCDPVTADPATCIAWMR
jgi:ADP-ribose pyrophosphatase YjhB (NUDIX family)